MKNQILSMMFSVSVAGCAAQVAELPPPSECHVLFSDPDWAVVELGAREPRPDCTPIDYRGDGGNDFWCPADWLETHQCDAQAPTTER